MERVEDQCKLFLPSKCLNAEASGILLGHQTGDGSSMCVTTLLEMPLGNRQVLEAIHAQYKAPNTKGLSIIGLWDNQTHSSRHLSEVNRCLKYAHTLNIPLVHLRKASAHQPHLSTCGPLVDKDLIIIIYDLAKLAESAFLTGSTNLGMDCNMNPSNLAFLSQSFIIYRDHWVTLARWTSDKGIVLHDFISNRPSLWTRTKHSICHQLHHLLTAYFYIFSLITSNLRYITKYSGPPL